MVLWSSYWRCLIFVELYLHGCSEIAPFRALDLQLLGLGIALNISEALFCPQTALIFHLISFLTLLDPLESSVSTLLLPFLSPPKILYLPDYFLYNHRFPYSHLFFFGLKFLVCKLLDDYLCGFARPDGDAQFLLCFEPELRCPVSTGWSEDPQFSYLVFLYFYA